MSGSAFTLGRGYSLVWSGWDPGAPRANDGMRRGLPPALEDGKPIAGASATSSISAPARPGMAASCGSPTPRPRPNREARLACARPGGDPRTELPADSWEFVDDRSIRLLPAGENSPPVKIYEIWYEATGAKVSGIGFAATRDLVSFLRHETGAGNPLAAEGVGAKHALAFGVSQSGRFLRHFLELGMNDDGRGRRVFDGVLSMSRAPAKCSPTTASRMPGRTATQHEDRLYPENWFPFSQAVAADPFSGRQGAILAGRATDPLVIEANTATEYWQKGASLVHIDPAGRNGPRTAGERARLHDRRHAARRARPAPIRAPGLASTRATRTAPTPALRALFVALEEWVGKGVAPPASRVPTIAQGTAVRPQPHQDAARAGDGDRAGRQPHHGRRSIGSIRRARLDNFYETRVCAVDPDGNEIAGIRLPPIAVPLGTYTGWNVYRAQPCELCRPRRIADCPSPRTRAERQAAGDPRPSLKERYGTREAYVSAGQGRGRCARCRPPAAASGRRGLCQGRRRCGSVLSRHCVKDGRRETTAARPGSSPPGQSRRRPPSGSSRTCPRRSSIRDRGALFRSPVRDRS